MDRSHQLRAGHDPGEGRDRDRGLTGLDLLGALGLPVAVIPHYDNAEGGTHDTRFCYLGEPRLAALEHELPDESAVLGIDEHTAVIVDLSTSLVRVWGRGVMTIRRRGASVLVPGGPALPLEQLRDLWSPYLAVLPIPIPKVMAVSAPRMPGLGRRPEGWADR
ncbi:hypothetical protein [Streptomyces anulatus]|uniref:hypothetical protein n=1 Tax=Streptomyces anulatus TaxID=1892 RepID=UPI0037131F60